MANSVSPKKPRGSQSGSTVTSRCGCRWAAALKSGSFSVFTGPIKAQDGSIKVAAGKTMTDKEIDSVNWYVEGVEGQLPK